MLYINKIFLSNPEIVVFRSRHYELFYINDILKNVKKFTEKYLCWGILSNKVAGWKAESLLKKRLWQLLSCEFAKFSRTHILWKTCEWLFLYIHRLISTWKMFPCTQFLLIHLIWLCLKNKGKRNDFDSFTNSKWNLFWFLTIHYFLGSPSCF